MENEIEAFIRFLAVERGLSENYQISTQRSLGEFAAWCLQRKQITRAREVGLPLISEYLAERKRGGLSALIVVLMLGIVVLLIRRMSTPAKKRPMLLGNR
jgi:integrase/recombinase XerD